MDKWLYDRLCTIPGLNDISEKVIGDLEGLVGFVDIWLENEQESLRYADWHRDDH